MGQTSDATHMALGLGSIGLPGLLGAGGRVNIYLAPIAFSFSPPASSFSTKQRWLRAHHKSSQERCASPECWLWRVEVLH
jgi:hypothetical protein